MQPLAIFLVLLSAAMHALRNFLTKKARDKEAFVWWYEVVGLFFFTPLFFWVLFTEYGKLSISLSLVLLSGFVHFIYWYFLSKALSRGDLSLVYPIMRSSPVLVLVFSLVFLQEKVSPTGVAGILLVAFGVYAINMKRWAIRELSRPFLSLFQDRATQFAFLTLLSVASYSLVDKSAVERMHPVIFAYAYPWLSLGLFTVHIFRVKPAGRLRKEWADQKWPIMMCGILSIFGYFLILLAFTLERVSYIVGLRQVSVVFAVLLGGRFLKEGSQPIRLTASLLIFAGCYLIATAK
jgi:drug/metabolite transporter (DMT)-like permease